MAAAEAKKAEELAAEKAKLQALAEQELKAEATADAAKVEPVVEAKTEEVAKAAGK